MSVALSASVPSRTIGHGPSTPSPHMGARMKPGGLPPDHSALLVSSILLPPSSLGAISSTVATVDDTFCHRDAATTRNRVSVVGRNPMTASYLYLSYKPLGHAHGPLLTSLTTKRSVRLLKSWTAWRTLIMTAHCHASPPADIWDRLRTSFSCVCLQASRLRATATCWRHLLQGHNTEVASDVIRALQGAADWICQADIAAWLSGPRHSTFYLGHL